MQTPTYVRKCREIISEIKLLEIGKRDRTHVAKIVKTAIESNTNPTLPTYQKMVELAKKHKLLKAS